MEPAKQQRMDRTQLRQICESNLASCELVLMKLSTCRSHTNFWVTDGFFWEVGQLLMWLQDSSLPLTETCSSILILAQTGWYSHAPQAHLCFKSAVVQQPTEVQQPFGLRLFQPEPNNSEESTQNKNMCTPKTEMHARCGVPLHGICATPLAF